MAILALNQGSNSFHTGSEYDQLVTTLCWSSLAILILRVNTWQLALGSGKPAPVIKPSKTYIAYSNQEFGWYQTGESSDQPFSSWINLDVRSFDDIKFNLY